MTDRFELSAPTELRDKLAQLMFIRIGSNLPPTVKVEQDVDRVLACLEQCPLGGLVLFNGDRERTPDTLQKLQSNSRYPLLISADIERGVGQQIHGYTLVPHAMSFSSLGSETEVFAEQFGYNTALLARGVGIHITFSPVADVSVDPKNPVISTRSPGRQPAEVAAFARGYVAGCRRGGVLSTAKHYPGHGNTHEDSHDTVPTVQASRTELENCDLVPFQAAVDAGVPLVMTAHVRFPALDPSDRCATLSSPILSNLLRSGLGFEGAVITDSLLMAGIKTDGQSEGELAAECLNAGVDILLDVAEPLETLDGLLRAVEQGQLQESRVEDAFQRVWKLKTSMFTQEPPNEREILVACEQEGAFAAEVAQRAITLEDDRGRLPWESQRRTCGVVIRHSSDPPDREHRLGGLLRERFPGCDYFELSSDFGESDCAPIRDVAQRAEQLVVAMNVKPAAWHKFWLTPQQIELLRPFSQLDGCVFVSLGTPEILHEFDAPVKICTFSDVPVSQAALVERLVGD